MPLAANVAARRSGLQGLPAVRRTTEAVVALCATIVESLSGRLMAIFASRGKTLRVGDRPAIVTYHRSAVLRADAVAAEIRGAPVADLRLADRLVVADA